MKIRIRGNSIRFRLTRSEVERLCLNGLICDQTEFAQGTFRYEVTTAATFEELSAEFEDATIRLIVPQNHIKDWNLNEKVGFEHHMKFHNGRSLHLLLEKDFTCLTDRGEDERDNYENPRAIK